MEIKEITDSKEYRPHDLAADCHLTQAWFYGDWQKERERKVKRFGAFTDKNSLFNDAGQKMPVAFWQVVKIPLPFEQNFLYIPHGPVAKNTDETFWLEFSRQMKELAREEKSVFSRFDSFPPEKNPPYAKLFYKATPESYRSSSFQPTSEWILDISQSNENILAGMHPNHRRSIRAAEKNGVEIKIFRETNLGEGFDVFWKLMRETAERAEFRLHEKKYYENIFSYPARESAGRRTEIKADLFVAEYQKKVLAAHLLIYFGQTAFFLFGGSAREHANMMPTQLAHWRAMQEARARGCKFYNFGAVAGRRQTSSQSLEGVSKFKQKFGGFLQEYGDFHDIISHPWRYKIYNWYKKFK